MRTCQRHVRGNSKHFKLDKDWIEKCMKVWWVSNEDMGNVNLLDTDARRNLLNQYSLLIALSEHMTVRFLCVCYIYLSVCIIPTCYTDLSMMAYSVSHNRKLKYRFSAVQHLTFSHRPSHPLKQVKLNIQHVHHHTTLGEITKWPSTCRDTPCSYRRFILKKKPLKTFL